MLAAAPWFIATDADKSGDKAAEKWPARAIRVRPPEPFKDWTEAAQAGVNLRCWWLPRLGGTEALWNHLDAQRWGPALNDPNPGDPSGALIDRPLSQDPARLKAAFEGADQTDPYAVAKRLAIQEENQP